MVEMLLRMKVCRIEPKRLRMVHSRPDGVGKFALVEGIKEEERSWSFCRPFTSMREKEDILQRWRLFSRSFPLFR